MELKNSVILITGGNSGIGLEFVKQLTRQGSKIIITGRNLESLRETKKKFPEIEIFASDVTRTSDIESLFDQVTHHFPDLNVIINNAGIMRLIDLEDDSNTTQDITREIETNLTGTIQMVQEFLPHLKKQKRAAIINVSSAIAFMPYSSAPVYSASKAGVHAYTQALRLQLEKTNIKVFEVIPPGVNTNLQDDWVLKPDANQMMKVDSLVAAVIKGILKDKFEIRPGLSGVVKFMSRFAPGFLIGVGHREFAKFRNLNSLHKSVLTAINNIS